MNKRLLRAAQLIVLLIFSTTKAQELPFTQVVENNFTIKGDLQMIGNSIVSIDQFLEQDRFGDPVNRRFAPNDDFNERISNGNILMNYIDIDGGDNDTVSSSSADLTLPSSCSEILYAGLYWSGTYFWNTPAFIDSFDGPNGTTSDFLTGEDTGRPAYIDTNGLWTETPTPIRATYPNRNYGNNDSGIANPRTQNDANDFRYIKFALPGSDYIDITPTSAVPSKVLFDGFAFSYTPPAGGNNNTSITDVPYVAYADVTSILKDLENPSGTYTVGNVKCYTGSTDGGGTAGGWTLVVTYKDPNEPARYISSFEGYGLIRAQQAPVTYDYSAFQTVPNGPVRAAVGVVSLEGDEGFIGDRLSISTPTNPTFTALSSGVSPADNFFNSSISVDGNFVTTRNPASENTLGYDQDIFRIENPNNSLIANGETSATFELSTSGDTFATFLNTFVTEVIEPNVRIMLDVQDTNGNSIPSDEGVLLGDEVFYELTVQNIGSDDAINTIIRDNIPENAEFLPGTVEVPATGVTYSYDTTLRQLVFAIDDALVEIGDSPFTIRFKVQVATSCETVRDACSGEVVNKAEAIYEGRISAVAVSSETCRDDVAIAANFIIDLGTCTFDFETFICNGEALLTAGNDFQTYTWRDSEGEFLGNSQTIIVNQSGTYTVEGVASDCRNILETHTVIQQTVDNQNPIFTLTPPVVDSIAFCSVDNTTTPEIYICGNEQVLLDLSSLANVSIIEWERLDTSSCAPNPIEGCPNTDTSCDWVIVGTDPVFTINDTEQTFPTEGEYRISVVFANTCTEYFYFNVYQNNLEPIVVKQDIICGNPGFVRVENVPETGYEFSLDNLNYQDSNEFAGITTAGEITVYIRNSNANAGTQCVFEEQITLFANCDLSTDTFGKALDATIYPNPTAGPVHVSTTIDAAVIMDINGKIVHKTTNASFDIGHLPKGVYFVKVEKEAQTGIHRIIKR